MSPTLSVCLPMYRSAATVAATIASLRAQSFDDFECLVRDDGRLDDGLAVAEEAAAGDARFRFAANPERLGAAGNWNRTLADAAGEFVLLLCADDLLAPGGLTAQVGALRSQPSAVLSTGRRDVVDDRGRTLIRGRGWRWRRPLVAGRTALRRFVRTGTNGFGEPSFVMLRREPLVAAGGFDGDWDYLIDVMSYARLLRSAPLAPVEEVLGSFRVSAGSWSAALAGRQAAETRSAVVEIAGWPEVDAGPLARLGGQAQATGTAWARRAVFAAVRRAGARAAAEATAEAASGPPDRQAPAQ